MSEKERPQLIIDYEANTDKLVRLGDVVDQFKGKAVPAKAEPGEFAVINLSDMTPNGIAYDDLKTFSEERRKLLRFLLEDGDVLIASKGTVQKVAVFENQGKREVVASSNITVLRPRKNSVVSTSSSFLRPKLVVPIWTMLIRERLSSIYRQLTSWTSKFLRYRLLSKITKLRPTYVGVPISTVRWFVQSKSGKISSIMLQKLYLEINQKPANLDLLVFFYYSRV